MWAFLQLLEKASTLHLWLLGFLWYPNNPIGLHIVLFMRVGDLYTVLILNAKHSACGFFSTKNFPNGNWFLTYKGNNVICTSSNISPICHTVYTEVSCIRIQPVLFMVRHIVAAYRHWDLGPCTICDVPWDRKLDSTLYAIVKYYII